MSQQTRQTFDRLYGDAAAPENLPWTHSTPSEFLEQVVAERPAGGRALDLGCGSGVDSVFLAQQGWQVTCLDFMRQAVEMTVNRAAAAGVTVDAQVADITTWRGDGTFALIVDAGCLHALEMGDRPAYRRKLLEWLAIGGHMCCATLNDGLCILGARWGQSVCRAGGSRSYLPPNLWSETSAAMC